MKNIKRSTASLALLGTGSDVGKSWLVAALCRYFWEEGYKVAPFKAQNMSNNSFVTWDAKEMGRAQAVQAKACKLQPDVRMNPILLKPNSDQGSQLILHGIANEHVKAKEYYKRHEALWKEVTATYDDLAQDYDLVILEGAGSLAEVNLMQRDLTNLKMAAYAKAPVILAADIARGGVFAQLVGSLAVIQPQEAAQIQALLVNRFRGDASLFQEGIDYLTAKTKKPMLGVLPELMGLKLDAEDAYSLSENHQTTWPTAKIKVAVLQFPRISNFTDLQPLDSDHNFKLKYIQRWEPLDSYDLLILPGSKSVMADLQWLEDTGLAGEIQKAAQQGARILGICGGYQMLGQLILDRDRVESPREIAEGLALLPHSTAFSAAKILGQVQGYCMGAGIQGYEIHQGQSQNETGWVTLQESQGSRVEGSINKEKTIAGSYLHGLLDEAEFRHTLWQKWFPNYQTSLDHYSDKLEEEERSFHLMAEHVREFMDLELLHRLIDPKNH